ncbi:MAG: alpha/beta hydrolase [Proteobacteria bacterium]|nr:alpha/beta hydrolase [Pseudomonadota bacterium]
MTTPLSPHPRHPHRTAPSLWQRARRSLLALLILFAATACQGGGEGLSFISFDTEVPSHVPPATSAFTPATCPAGLPRGVSVQCGWLAVPEDPARPDGPRIQLAVTRYFSARPNPAPDPVIYLEGGPGGSGVSTVAAMFSEFGALRADRDLITFDQRGTGSSLPGLYCEDLLEPDYSAGGDDDGDSDDDYLQQLAQCHQQLTAQGHNLDLYNSATNAADVEALRVALGYDQWNLLGISYGTRLALTVMRDHPQGLRSVILDSTVPVEHNLFEDVAANAHRAFTALFDACAANAHCAAQYPDLMNALLQALDTMDENPPEPYLTGAVAFEILFQLMYSGSTLPYLPLLISQLAAGNYRALNSMYGQLYSAEGRFPIGMYLSVNCAEEAPFLDLERYDALTADLPARFREHFSPQQTVDFCQHWPVAAAPALETKPVRSDIPTLILAGYFDPVTPPANGEQVHAQLGQSQFMTFADGAHGVSLDPCGLETTLQFLASPQQSAQQPCLDRLAIGPFELLGRRAPIAFAAPTDSLPSAADLLPAPWQTDHHSLLRFVRARRDAVTRGAR